MVRKYGVDPRIYRRRVRLRLAAKRLTGQWFRLRVYYASSGKTGHPRRPPSLVRGHQIDHPTTEQTTDPNRNKAQATHALWGSRVRYAGDCAPFCDTRTGGPKARKAPVSSTVSFLRRHTASVDRRRPPHAPHRQLARDILMGSTIRPSFRKGEIGHHGYVGREPTGEMCSSTS